MSTSDYSQDSDLAKYFTDVEPLRAWFDQAIAAETMPKRLLVIWGVGGIGKSSLLRMFRLSARSKKFPVGLASGDEAKSAVDVLARWAEDLKNDSVTLSTFFKTYDHYRAIQAKVEDQAKAANKKLGDAAVKGAGKMVEAGAAAVVGAAVGSVIPGVGTIAGAIGGMGAEALADWLRGFLSKPDIDLYTDPTKRLTEDFLADLDKAALKQRIVLMLDTYEQMTALDDWTRELAQRLNPNVLFVIAGRAMVNWARKWDSWLMYAQVEEVKPMSKRVMHELIRRYYATMRGGEPDSKQVNDIIGFSGGLPMVVNTAVQLWVKYGVEDFGAVKGEVVREVVARLREGVPTELYPLLETAAALRYFNQDILRAVSGMDDISAGYEELLRFPFVRRRAEGYALHDRVREMIEENMRTDDPSKNRAVHERAAAYFEAQMASTSSANEEQLGLERLYHRVCADEETGIELFQEIAAEFVRLRLVNRLYGLFNDVNTYPLVRNESRLWVTFYKANLLDLEGRWLDAESLFRHIAESPSTPKRISSYALARWGTYLARPERISKPGGAEKAISILKSSLDVSANYDNNTILAAWELGIIYERLCRWDEAWKYFDEIDRYATALGKSYQSLFFKGLLQDPYTKVGNWREVLKLHYELLDLIDELPISSDMKANILPSWIMGLTWMGRYSEAEKTSRDGIKVSARLNFDASGYHRDLGFSLALQDRIVEAHAEFQKGIEESKEWMMRRANFDLDRAILLHYSFWGIVHLRAGELREARRKFLCATWLKRKHKDNIGFPELYVGLGLVSEVVSDSMRAAKWYSRCIDLKWTGRRNFECAALTGLVRVHHAQQNYASIPSLLTEAEQLAQQYEYNDHLASLRLTQGHIAWDGHIPEWGKGFDAVLGYYKLALVYALRYNRFLLDEVLSGRPQGTPLRPIILECLKRGEEGRKMLVALREWWQTGLNDVGTSRPVTISPIPENISLLEAEKIAREREPGDGSAQTSVAARIDAALAN